MKAIAMTSPDGGLDLIDVPGPVPGPGKVVVEIAAAGVNFMDIGVRRGIAWSDVPNPKVIGVEGAGRVVGLGEGVADYAIGDRVAWVYAPGSYAEQVEGLRARWFAFPMRSTTAPRRRS